MDWTDVLKAQQADFIQRLKSGCLLHCEEEGKHSELTVISGEKLKQLREFCWQMAEKYKRTSPVRDVFINNLKGKLGEEVVKARLGNLVTAVDYETRIGGDGKVDFTLTSYPYIGIQVKARHGDINKVRWSINKEEINKNVVLICTLIQEEVTEAQFEYNLIFAGFLPINMINTSDKKASVKIDELLYAAGLCFYLENLKYSLPEYYIDLGDQSIKKGDLNGGVNNYTYALKLNPSLGQIYSKRANIHFSLGNAKEAIDDYNRAISMSNNNFYNYLHRGIIYYELGNKKQAIRDFTEAMNVNSQDYFVYIFRANAHYFLGNYTSAIEDYNKAIGINPNNANSYYNRGVAKHKLGNTKNAIDDLEKAASIYHQEGKLQEYKNVNKQIKDITYMAQLHEKIKQLQLYSRKQE